MSKNGRNLAIGVVVAAAVGYVVGLLTAPKSGKETRQDIKDAAVRTKKEAEARLKSAYGELTKLMKTVAGKAKTAKGKAKQEAESVANLATAAKEKVRVALDTFNKGESSDKDLEKAVKDAESSIEHIKTFLKKKD